jgi:hypothetical protein
VEEGEGCDFQGRGCGERCQKIGCVLNPDAVLLYIFPTTSMINSLQSTPIYAELARRKLAKYPRAEAKVHKQYLERRARGLPVSGHWLRSRLRGAVRNLYPQVPAAQKFKASRKYLMLFCRRHQMVKRKRTNCKRLRCVMSLQCVLCLC